MANSIWVKGYDFVTGEPVTIEVPMIVDGKTGEMTMTNDELETFIFQAKMQEREACVQIILIGQREMWTTMQIIDEIRARKAG